jgi:NADH:ubiquinone oxidoreductase subunit 2 (subunit N)
MAIGGAQPRYAASTARGRCVSHRMEIDVVDSLARLGPELALAMALVFVWLRGLSASAAAEVAVLGAAISFFLCAELYGWGEVWVLDRMLVVDGLALFGKACVALALLGSLSAEARAAEGSRRATRFLVAALALDVTGSAGNTVAAYLGLEIAASAIASLGSAAGTAGATAAALSSATIAGTLAWISALAGSSDYEEIRKSVVGVAPLVDFRVAIAAWLLLAGIAVRLGVVAFRVRNDGGAGSLFAAGLAIEALVVVLRAFFGALGAPGVEATGAAPVALGGSTALTVAALAALAAAAIAFVRSRSLVERLVASSIATLGYALVEAASASREGIRAALVSTASAVVPTIGAFHAVSITARGRLCRPARAALVASFLVALGVAPLFCGSAGAPGIFTAALRAGGDLIGLTVFACVAIELGTYVRAIASVFGEPAVPAAEAGPDLAEIAMLALFAALTLALVLDPGALVRLAARSAVWLPM